MHFACVTDEDPDLVLANGRTTRMKASTRRVSMADATSSSDLAREPIEHRHTREASAVDRRDDRVGSRAGEAENVPAGRMLDIVPRARKAHAPAFGAAPIGPALAAGTPGQAPVR